MLRETAMDTASVGFVEEIDTQEDDQVTDGLGAFTGVLRGILASGALWLGATVAILTLR
jgi:hypothetical protein